MCNSELSLTSKFHIDTDLSRFRMAYFALTVLWSAPHFFRVSLLFFYQISVCYAQSFFAPFSIVKGAWFTCFCSIAASRFSYIQTCWYQRRSTHVGIPSLCCQAEITAGAWYEKPHECVRKIGLLIIIFCMCSEKEVFLKDFDNQC